jgi:acylphosphatase
VRQCKRYQVRGHVQGVFFRSAARDEARRLGLTGWVRNLPNGDVELLACGDQDKLHDMVTWLWKGPPMARVDKVVSELADDDDSVDDFVVR